MIRRAKSALYNGRCKPVQDREIAKERIAILFREASIEFKEHPELANRYVFLARKIAMRYNVHMTGEQRLRYCHKCYHYFLPGKNCKVRTNPKTQCVERTCLDCGHVGRYGYSKEKLTHTVRG